jgi:hypothetical protein
MKHFAAKYNFLLPTGLRLWRPAWPWDAVGTCAALTALFHGVMDLFDPGQVLLDHGRRFRGEGL